MPLKLYRRGAIWHYRGSVAGRRLRGSTRTAQKEVAQQVVSKLESRTWEGHLYGPEAVLTFARAAGLYRDSGKWSRYLDSVEDYWKNTPVRSITGEAIRQTAIKMYPHHSGATRNRSVIVPMQAIINYAAKLNHCQKIAIERFPVEKKEKRPVTQEWVRAFMAHANPHLGALACFMFATGARISEALAVTWNDVDLNKRRALIRQTKLNNDERWAHMPAPLVAAIANIEGERIGKVFRYSSRSTAKIQWNKAIKRAGIEKLSFHCCRHGFATSLMHVGVDPVTVAKRGGWKSPKHVFDTYGHAVEDETVTDRLFDTPQAQTTGKALANKV